ncbi:hypothetical protein [Caulobacter mirabilis]|uniref:Superoxide dismutase n=1 Tax=Caulobacter mirabilis TaxID=69666 RepID=A0A2D2AV18_9CAUL|nr:hypothetical protein [Caulobacter mirabilis]ATQ41850.1 hypothetical protein CSW64_05195 [Caulobacter mirabilis]
MTYRTLLLAAVAASFAVAANAQETPAQQPEDANPPAAESAATPSSATAGTEFKVGATVKDREGAALGTIQGVSEGDTGPVVVVQIDGALYGLSPNSLTSAGGETVSTQTKAEIVASAKPKK